MPDKRKTGERTPGRPKDNEQRKPDLSAEDARLWARVAADTRPLAKDKGESAAPPKSEPERKRPLPKALPTKAAGPAPAVPAPSRPALSAGAAPGVDKRLAGRLRRGQLPIDGRVDLHGMTQAQAHAVLEDFIVASRHGGRRCVLVITGKGGTRGTDDFGRPRPGVLREVVPKWLNTAVMRPHILSFSQAQPKHGGAGAFYVLLKRLR